MVIHLTRRISKEDWNRSAARHLLNRAGFGVPTKRIDQLARLGPRRAVNLMLNGHPGAQPIEEPDWLTEAESFQERRKEFKDLDQEQRRKLRMQMQRQERQAINRLKTWWLLQMLNTEHPLREKMAHFWHGHFATSAAKVTDANLMHLQNELLRKFKHRRRVFLLTAVGTDVLKRFRSSRRNRNCVNGETSIVFN